MARRRRPAPVRGAAVHQWPDTQRGLPTRGQPIDLNETILASAHAAIRVACRWPTAGRESVVELEVALLRERDDLPQATGVGRHRCYQGGQLVERRPIGSVGDKHAALRVVLEALFKAWRLRIDEKLCDALPEVAVGLVAEALDHLVDVGRSGIE